MSDKITLRQGTDGFELEVFGKENWIMRRELGYSPVQSIVASAAACGGYVYQHLLENSHISATFDRVEADYTRQKDNVGAITSIQLTFFISVEESDQPKAQTCLKLVSRYCPVIQSLDPAIEIVETVEFI